MLGRKDEGFVLVTVLILIGVLSVLGAVGAYKSVIETKVSKYAGDASRAEQIAAAGLQQIFWYWTQSGITSTNCQYANGQLDPGCAERVAVMDYVLQNQNTLPATAPFVLDLYADSVAGLDQAPAVTGAGLTSIDAFIRQSGNVRVYEYARTNGVVTGMNVVANNTWGTSSNPQVAVWSTGYQQPTSASAYPFDPAGAQCRGNGCSLVMYALGRDGESRALMREVQGVVSQQLTGVSAITNAPGYGSWQEMCQEANPKSTAADNGGTALSGTGLDNTVIEVTQAPYVRNLTSANSNPSGTALLSNTRIGQGGKGFRNGTGSQMGLTFDQTPRILYTGHGPNAADNAVRGDPASMALDNTAPYDNLPAGQLPHNLVRAPVLNTPNELTYFPNGNSQLFQLDVYRWGAEQFTCQDPVNTGNVRNGRFCDNAERLRQAVDAIWQANYGVPALAPVTGRLTMAEFEYNVNYGIPMFGLIRVMLPTAPSGTSFNCTVNGNPVSGQMYKFTHGTLTTDPAGALGQYTGGVNAVDQDGKLDGTARLVVYGSLMFDFFTDSNNNDVFDPAAGERLLTPLEATDAYMKFEMPILINPVLPRDPAGGSSGFLAFPSAHAGGVIQAGSNANPVNVAAPDGSGYYPASEGLIPMTGSTNRQLGLTGTMRLMSNAAGQGLVDLTNQASNAFPPGNATAMFASESPDLRYFYDIYRAVANQGDIFSWPVAPFPAAIDGTTSFFIGQEDSIAGNNNCDQLHLLFPSGYMHGWKVALAALDLKAIDWNTLLSDGVGGGVDIYSNANSLYSQHATAKNYGDANYPKGSPFNPAVDPGFSQAGSLERIQSSYFQVEGDAPLWQPNRTYALGDMIKAVDPVSGNTRFFRASVAGTSGPSVNWSLPAPIVDNTVTWQDVSSGWPLLTSRWRDIPAEMYVGGLLDMHAHSNINGIVYTPGPLEWEPGNSNYAGDSNHYSYINGAIITGFGGYLKNKVQQARYVLVYANEAVDNINTANIRVVMRRYARQLLK